MKDRGGKLVTLDKLKINSGKMTEGAIWEELGM